MRKYSVREKHIGISTDVHVLSSTNYEKVIFGMPSVSVYGLFDEWMDVGLAITRMNRRILFIFGIQ
jgi:hypothetical protein